MADKNIIEVTPVTMYRAKKIMGQTIKGTEEPIYEQKICQDYLNKLAKLSPGDGDKIVKELQKVSDKIRPEMAVKIADLLPRDEEDIRIIFAKERVVLDAEEINKIVDICSAYRG